MKPFQAFVLGSAITPVAGFFASRPFAQVAGRSDDRNSSTSLSLGNFSLSIPEGGTGVVSEPGSIYIVKPNKHKIYALSKTSSENGKPVQFEFDIP